MKFSKSIALAVLTLNTLLITSSAEAGETRLKRPTVLFGSAQKHHQDAEPAASVNPDAGVLEGNTNVESLFPTRAAVPALTGMAAQKDSLGNRPLSGKLTAQELALLSKRELIVFIDKSFSMNERDCPHVPGEIPVNDRSAGFLGGGSGNISRWRWTAAQTMDLANQVAPVQPDGFKLILFNDWRQEFKNVKPSDVPMIFMSTKVGGSENIVLFLAEQLNQYMERKRTEPKTTRPLAIAVLTDGLPDDRANFPSLLINTTKQMSSAEDIKIVFIQVGRSRKGESFLVDMDNKLVGMGAKFDIVDHKSFEQVQSSGVGRAIVDAIVE